MAITRFHVEPGFTVALRDNVLFMHQEIPTTVKHIHRIEQGYLEMLRVHSKVFGFISIVPGSNDAQDKGVNAQSEAMLKNLGPRLGAVVLVFPGEDMRATVFRTVIRGINVVTRGTTLKPAKSVEDAAAQLAPLAATALGKPVDPRHLVEAMAETRLLR